MSEAKPGPHAETGDILFQLRDTLKASQDQFAEAMGYRGGRRKLTIGHWEMGHKPIPPEKLTDIAKAATKIAAQKTKPFVAFKDENSTIFDAVPEFEMLVRTHIADLIIAVLPAVDPEKIRQLVADDKFDAIDRLAITNTKSVHVGKVSQPKATDPLNASDVTAHLDEDKRVIGG